MSKEVLDSDYYNNWLHFDLGKEIGSLELLLGGLFQYDDWLDLTLMGGKIV
jgi:hypothetical protein